MDWLSSIGYLALFYAFGILTGIGLMFLFPKTVSRQMFRRCKACEESQAEECEENLTCRRALPLGGSGEANTRLRRRAI